MIQEFISDGCTGFPDLWIKSCCYAHDLAAHVGLDESTSDIEFFKCIVQESEWLGPLAKVCGFFALGFLFIFRPAYKRFKAARKSGKLKDVDSGKLNG